MIPEGWLAYKLSDLVDLIGGGTPKTSVPEYWNGNIPWLSVVDFGKNTKHVFNTEKTITEKGLFESSTKVLKKGYLVISARGTVGELAMLGEDMAFNQSCYGINSKDKTINDYIYYLIKHNVNQIKRKTHGAVFETITRLTFENIDVQIPQDLREQTRIAAILSSLDDKIELNLQMNKTLEAIAQAIFKEWFVDFRFPGFNGELVEGLPMGWSKQQIGSLFNYNVGGDWGKEDQSDDFQIKTAIIRGTDFKNIMNGDISKVPIRYIKRSNIEKKRVTHGDILLEISGGSPDQPTGRTMICTDPILKMFDCPVVPASFCRLIRPLNFNHSIFLSTFLSYFYDRGGTWEYQNQSTGISNFQFRYFAENKLIAAPKDGMLINEFGSLLNPIFERHSHNIIQICILTNLRDTILPKLMTGKIRAI